MRCRVTGEYLNDYQVTFITKEVDKYEHKNSSIIINNKELATGRLKQKSIVRTHKTFWIEKRHRYSAKFERNWLNFLALSMLSLYFITIRLKGLTAYRAKAWSGASRTILHILIFNHPEVVL